MSPLRCALLDLQSQTLAEKMSDQLRASEECPVINLAAALWKDGGHDREKRPQINRGREMR